MEDNTNRGMLYLCEIILKGAIMDYYRAVSENHLEEVEERRRWFKETGWVSVYCDLQNIDIDTLLEKTERLALS